MDVDGGDKANVTWALGGCGISVEAMEVGVTVVDGSDSGGNLSLGQLKMSDISRCWFNDATT